MLPVERSISASGMTVRKFLAPAWAMQHQGVPEKTVAAQLALERAYATTLEETLQKVTLQLDSVCGFVIDR